MEKERKNLPILKISFLESDSAQYLNVEPPGMVLGAFDTSAFWALGSRGVQVAVTRMLVRVRRR